MKVPCRAAACTSSSPSEAATARPSSVTSTIPVTVPLTSVSDTGACQEGCDLQDRADLSTAHACEPYAATFAKWGEQRVNLRPGASTTSSRAEAIVRRYS